ncbi:hypothetical protein CJU89_6151 [Yarrowia sp. B02]|nr:hypothetical protein CJU89_6151 [Yarrowia sp. B02]
MLSERTSDVQPFLGKTFQTYLQQSLRDLVESQDEDIQEWFEQDVVGGFRNHIVPSSNPSPGVILEDKPRTPQITHLPAEVASLVYYFSDVETCVALREVSTQRYSVFHRLTFWRSKMAERNPWMTPGDGDCKTWQDVVLVFTRRLQGGKWKTTEDMSSSTFDNDLRQATRDQRPKRKWVSTRELKFNEKLPPSFSSFFRDGRCDSGCEHVHVAIDATDETKMVDIAVDPWTMETLRFPEKQEIVSLDKDTFVFRVRKLELTLPAYTGLVKFDVTIRNATIWLRIEDGGTLVLPRE